MQRTSHEFLNFVDHVLDLLEAHPNGLRKEDFLNLHYDGALPDEETSEKTWKSLRRQFFIPMLYSMFVRKDTVGFEQDVLLATFSTIMSLQR